MVYNLFWWGVDTVNAIEKRRNFYFNAESLKRSFIVTKQLGASNIESHVGKYIDLL